LKDYLFRVSDLNPHLRDCDICIAANNCTDDQKCAGFTAGRSKYIVTINNG